MKNYKLIIKSLNFLRIISGILTLLYFLAYFLLVFTTEDSRYWNVVHFLSLLLIFFFSHILFIFLKYKSSGTLGNIEENMTTIILSIFLFVILAIIGIILFLVLGVGILMSLNHV